jgi:putative SOS response-associated peptidase YedK
MCERYVLPSQPDSERELTPRQCWWKFSPSFNVAPGQYVPAVQLHAGQTEGVMMRWGLIPAWAEGDVSKVKEQTAHVAVDDIERSYIYGTPWLNGQRCIVPVAGFYVWQLTPQKYRQPHFVRVRDRACFGVAAVWDRTTTEDDDVIEGFALLTVPVNSLLGELDTRMAPRMPAILRPGDYKAWFESPPAQAKALLRTYPAEEMEAYPVSPRVNSLRFNGPELITPIDH